MTRDPYRPKYHMLPPSGWINDPNGFCFYRGGYHLYYQYYPYAPEPEKMYWGHSSSRDLVHWDYHGIALSPDMPYDKEGVFSGTAYVDGDRLTAMYTGVMDTPEGKRQVQCIAHSNDGDSFEKYSGNPVMGSGYLPANSLAGEFRDPKIWKRGDLYYCLCVAIDEKGFGKLPLYRSKDMLNWEFVTVALSGEGLNLGRFWECPDYFALDGKDVIIVSAIDIGGKDAVMYFVGSLDYETGLFSYESFDKLDHGNAFYAPQTALDDKGRRILIAWQQCWGSGNPTAEYGWAGHMTLPRVLSLSGGRLVQSVPEEVKSAFSGNIRVKAKGTVMIEAENVCSMELGGEEIELDVYVDNSSIEVFAKDGRTMSCRAFAKVRIDTAAGPSN